MEIEKLLQDILYVVITGILPLITVYVVNFLKIKIKENYAKLEGEQLQKYIKAASDSIEKAVLSVNQTYVDTLKKNGTFTKEAHDIAKSMAIELAKELITEESKKAINVLYNDFNKYLESSIESLVRDNKLEVKKD